MPTRITRTKPQPRYVPYFDKRDAQRVAAGLPPRLPHQGDREKARRLARMS